MQNKFLVAGKGYPPEAVYGKHAGETVFIIGNSSSLVGQDLSILNGWTTVGLNRILRVYEPTYLMVVDQSVMREEWERMMACCDHVKMLIYPGAMSSPIRAKYTGPWISTGPMTGQCDPTAKTGPVKIPTNGNSAYECAQIVYRMGAKRIGLLGVDMYWPPGKASHFFGSGVKSGCKLPRPELQVQDFKILKGLYKALGVELFSCSPWDTPFRQVIGYKPLEEFAADL